MHHDLARQLRKNMTDEERRLWKALRFRQLRDYKFRRQAPVGEYIVDFVSFAAKLVLELDGGQHAEQVEEDQRRSDWLRSQGFTILRFWNHQIKEDLDAVLEVVWGALPPARDRREDGNEIKSLGISPYPPPPPSPTRGEGVRRDSP